MTPEPESLKAHFADLNDAALLQVASERDTHTPEAQAILLNKLQTRGLNPPDLTSQLEDPTPETSTWVTVERFRDLSSAIVARGALEAAEIPCFLRDENTVRLDWQISNFIGGMRLQVQQQDENAARLVLLQSLPTEMPAEPGSTLEPEEHCPSCGSPDVHRVERGVGLRATALWLFALPLPRGARFWRCLHCGRQIAERDLVLLPES
ncbi:DUF2007 domain-containing protein [Terriglobus sp.]|uniref:putative signal transducing protein n=1 Tax=Terriglobus sp. TaxID=1889013 RepID=UPI003AFF9376